MTASFTFGIRSGSVGEILPAQLTVTSQTQPTSTSVRLTEIEITFDGGLRAIVMSHSDLSEPLASLENGKVEYFETKAQDSKYSTAVSSPTTPLSQRSFSTLAELTFLPGNKKVFLLNLIPRDSGEVKATQVILRIREESFYFDVGVKLPENNRRVYWWYTQGESLLQRKLHLEQHTSIAILPKPPKLQIELPTWRKTYYFNEMVYIAIRLRNEENEIADIQLHIHLNGVKAPRLNWSLEDSDEMDLEGRSLGQISPGESGEYVVSFHAPNATAEFSFQILADYVLIADPQTPITKSIKHGLQVIAPFEANYEFQPRIHPEPWPSYFNVDTIHTEESGSRGLKQNWSITIKIASFAAESLTINAVTLEVLDTTNCLLSALTTRTPIPTVGITIQPSVIYEHQFFLEIQKASLEDHRHATLTFNLDISWERSSPFPSGVPAISTLLVPPLTLAFGEPRLIATSSTSMTDISMINMTYTLENPSMHILTFSLSMEASEEFAFSGPKNSTVRLLPLSRNTIKYNIFPAKQGIWLKPSFKCLDLGFGKVLRCLAGKGCRIDRQRGLVIWAHAE